MGIDGEEYCIGHWMASNQIKEFLTNQIFWHRRKKSVFWAAAVSQRRAERRVPHLTFERIISAELWSPPSQPPPHMKSHLALCPTWTLPRISKGERLAKSVSWLDTFSTRNLTQEVWPSQMAASRGEMPCLSAESMFAPCTMDRCQTEIEWSKTWFLDTFEIRYWRTSSWP